MTKIIKLNYLFLLFISIFMIIYIYTYTDIVAYSMILGLVLFITGLQFRKKSISYLAYILLFSRVLINVIYYLLFNGLNFHNDLFSIITFIYVLFGLSVVFIQFKFNTYKLN